MLVEAATRAHEPTKSQKIRPLSPKPIEPIKEPTRKKRKRLKSTKSPAKDIHDSTYEPVQPKSSMLPKQSQQSDQIDDDPLPIFLQPSSHRTTIPVSATSRSGFSDSSDSEITSEVSAKIPVQQLSKLSESTKLEYGLKQSLEVTLTDNDV